MLNGFKWIQMDSGYLTDFQSVRKKTQGSTNFNHTWAVKMVLRWTRNLDKQFPWNLWYIMVLYYTILWLHHKSSSMINHLSLFLNFYQHKHTISPTI